MTALHSAIHTPFSRRHDRTNPDVKLYDVNPPLRTLFLDLTADSFFLPKPF